MPKLVCAADVGTRSVRASIFDRYGTLLGKAMRPIALNKSTCAHAQHDSENIWAALSAALREARENAGAAAEDVAGISFDATCSLVVRGGGGRQLSVSLGGEPGWDTIAWFDHRGLAEAEECTGTSHRVLDYIGGVMSPEMQIPKLMWLKRHLPDTWRQAGYFFDLTDFLTWKATGSLTRSQCTLTAKWTYLAHAGGWQSDFLDEVDLSDLLARGALPRWATAIGSDIGQLSPEAAASLGLTTACRVGTGLIDAFAGALGVIGARHAGSIEQHMALIAGTSSCVMAFSKEERPFASGWGPYYGPHSPISGRSRLASQPQVPCLTISSACTAPVARRTRPCTTGLPVG